MYFQLNFLKEKCKIKLKGEYFSISFWMVELSTPKIIHWTNKLSCKGEP